MIRIRKIKRPIALLTDFGLKDHYVGSLKAVILKINPKAVIFDVTHDVTPQNIREGAFVLAALYPVLPKNFIVVAVVDPGVGSARQAICVKTDKGYLIGPNNGLLGLALRDVKHYEVRAIENDRFFHKPVSSTFHGRDIFSPSAAWLSKKNVFHAFGPRLKDIHKIHIPSLLRKKDSIQGEIIYIDRFGNAFTNITKNVFPFKSFAIFVKKHRVKLKPFFSAGNTKELIAVWNSTDSLEFAVKENSAEKLFGLKVGDPVLIQK